MSECECMCHNLKVSDDDLQFHKEITMAIIKFASQHGCVAFERFLEIMDKYIEQNFTRKKSFKSIVVKDRWGDE